jgi:uncharacterized protein (TIGR03435 family)
MLSTRSTTLLLIAAALSLTSAQAQPKFEVASVRPNNSDEKMNYGVRGNSLSGTNMPLVGWIEIAHKVRDYQIKGPSWISVEKFDIEARAASGSSAGVMSMLQSLLADRFKLTLHRETQQLPVYDLVVDRRGLKMKPSADQTPWVGDFPRGSPDGRPTTGASPTVLAPGRFEGKAIPMSMFITLLSDALERPVINRTGQTGRFDIDLHYAPGSDTDSSPSVFTAMQEQLGLKLESAKGPVEVLVIDHIERPSAN